MAAADITAPDGSKLNIDYLKADGSIVLTTNWDAGNYEIRSRTFRSDISTGTAPFNVASTTIVTNLNAALLNDHLDTDFAKVDGTDNSANIDFSSSYGLRWNNNANHAIRGYVSGNIEIHAQIGTGDDINMFPDDRVYVSGDFYTTGDVSALTFTDRTPFYEGDAIAEIKHICGNNGKIDHSTLPEFAKRVIKNKIHKKDIDTGEYKVINTFETEGRDLGAMISILTVAVQQLTERIEQLESKI